LGRKPIIDPNFIAKLVSRDDIRRPERSRYLGTGHANVDAALYTSDRQFSVGIASREDCAAGKQGARDNYWYEAHVQDLHALQSPALNMFAYLSRCNSSSPMLS
jgi:hypothetical protein